jgi:hypothetical protein
VGRFSKQLEGMLVDLKQTQAFWMTEKLCWFWRKLSNSL